MSGIYKQAHITAYLRTATESMPSVRTDVHMLKK